MTCLARSVPGGGTGSAINAGPVHCVGVAWLEVASGFLPQKGVDRMLSDEDDCVVTVDLLLSRFTSKLVSLEIEIDDM